MMQKLWEEMRRRKEEKQKSVSTVLKEELRVDTPYYIIYWQDYSVKPE